jgi:hypothetical protein
MSVSLGTTSSSFATAFSTQRKIVKTSGGKLVLFANISGSIQYKTSTDNGATWDSSWTNVVTADTRNGFDIYIDTNDDIFLVYRVFADQAYFRKLTYGSGTWSIGSAVVISTSNSTREWVITKRSNGDLWAIAATDGGDNSIYYAYSTDGGSTWTKNNYNSGQTAQGINIVPHSTNIWAILQGGTALKIYEWTTSWSLLATVAASGLTNDVEVGTVRIDDNNIYVAVRTTSGIKVYYWNGSTWDSGTLLTDNANDTDPFMANVNSKPVLLWKDYDGTYYNIAYRNYNGSSWNSEVFLTSDAAVDSYSSGCYIDTTYLYSIWTTGAANPYTIYFNSTSLNPTKTQTITSDVKFFVAGQQQTINSDVNFTGITNQTINSDVNFQIIGEQQTINSDVEFVDLFQETILSDVKFKAVGIANTILSNVKFCIQQLYDINNKISFVKQSLYDTINKVSFVKRTLSNVYNVLIFVKNQIFNITNDFRTQKRIIDDVNNDFRFIASFQRAASGGMQSLGKSYIHVFFNSIEQTDIDVDSIIINKILNGPHTASIDLGRPYDINIPTTETVVDIYYNNWKLYTGYITEINPTDSPERINVICQDEYWYENRSNSYFYVGHPPLNATERYFTRPSTALYYEFGINWNLGGFVPETMNFFGVGKSDCISGLIQESGNFGWYYDINGVPQLWTGGAGSIINLDRQVIGTNLGLLQVLNHNFRKDISGVVNRYLVQMGDYTIKKYNQEAVTEEPESIEYTYDYFPLEPAWDAAYEKISYLSADGYGFDYPEPGKEDKYKEVYRKYRINHWFMSYTYDNGNREWWDFNDRIEPSIIITTPLMALYNPNKMFSLVNNFFSLGIDIPWYGLYKNEGYSVDFENQIVTFNEPIYFYSEDANSGDYISNQAAPIRIGCSVKHTYTKVLHPTQNPEEDVTNPLAFITSKVGTYPVTITKNLNLSGLTRQSGGTFYDKNGTQHIIPSWNDTGYAYDYALWQLSKTQEAKIIGNIEITLDALCYYNIDLAKRIMIDGIIENPLNITSISYNLSKFTVILNLENIVPFRRNISLPYHSV